MCVHSIMARMTELILIRHGETDWNRELRFQGHVDVPLNASALREQNFGVVNGKRVDDVKLEHAGAWNQWLRFEADYGMPGGETTRQFHTRVMDAVYRIAQQHRGQTVMVVTHGGVLDMIWRTARGTGLDGPRQSDIPNAGLNRVRVSGEAV